MTTSPNVDPRYSPSNLAELFLRDSRRRRAVGLLTQLGVFPDGSSEVLEVGVGRIGWMADVLGWGVPPAQLHGVDLDADRISAARELFPDADLRIADAQHLPWPTATFSLVIASTLLTSVLDDGVRQAIADEISRVLRPGGALLLFDFVVDSPSNPNVRRLGKHEARRLFSGLSGSIRSACLAPPLTRLLAPRMHWLATLLECVPILRTHMVAIFVKPIAVAFDSEPIAGAQGRCVG